MTSGPERILAGVNSSPKPCSAIALFSSSRRNGNTGHFINRIALDLNIEIVDLSSRRISAYDYEHLNRQDDFEPLMKHVLKHDQIIFATPIYWYSVSPDMKIFLDRISDFLELPDLLSEGRRLRGKRAYVVCTSISEAPSTAFLDAFRDTFDYLGMFYGGVAHVNCQHGYVPGMHDQHALTLAKLVRDAAEVPLER
jgi:multimeric flavodoxin WrbA